MFFGFSIKLIFSNS